MATTFTKLKSGDWGLRSEQKLSGTVTVMKKSGERQTVTVGRQVWAGNGVYLYSIQTGSGTSKRTSRRDWPGKECPTCGSEDLDNNLHCWECGYTGRR